jgi:hypothetical protein
MTSPKQALQGADAGLVYLAASTTVIVVTAIVLALAMLT